MTDAMPDIQETISAIRQEAEAASPLKLHQRVRACKSSGLNLVTGGPATVHDCNDPAQHFDTRVVGWDSLGRIEVAIDTRGSNPHCHSWCWTDAKLVALAGYDWFNSDYPSAPPLRSVGDKVFFMWEEPGWTEQSVGDTIPAVLQHPHIQYRDWIVRYRVPTDGRWISRVVNEMQMWTRTEEFE